MSNTNKKCHLCFCNDAVTQYIDNDEYVNMVCVYKVCNECSTKLIEKTHGKCQSCLKLFSIIISECPNDSKKISKNHLFYRYCKECLKCLESNEKLFKKM